MSRNDVKIQYPEEELYYGLFNASIIKVEDKKITLKDFFSKKELIVEFNLSLELDVTKAGKQIWLNQLGDVGYGNEKDLFDGFKYFIRNKETVGKKKYWKARKGELKLLNFLKNLHCLSPYDQSSDCMNDVTYEDLVNNDEEGKNLRKLVRSKYENSDVSIGGVLYISSDFKEKVLNYFVPAMKIPVLRNTKGNLQNLDKDISLKQIAYLFNNNFAPEGYYHWGNIIEYVHKIKRKNDETEI